jgi:hypothetical protein
MAIELVEVRTVDAFKPGSYLFGLKGVDVFSDEVLKALAINNYMWYGGAFSLFPPKPAFEGARSIFQNLINGEIKKLNLIAYVPKTNSLDPRKPPGGGNFRQPKFYNSKTKELLFWVDVKAIGGQPGTFNAAVQKIVDLFVNTVPLKLKGTPVSLFNLLKFDLKIYQTKGQLQKPTHPVTPVTPSSPNPAPNAPTPQKPIVVNVTVPPSNVGGGSSQYTMPTGQTVDVKPSQIAVDGLTNPWLWLAGGLVLFGLTFVIKQARGGLRELGGGVRSTYDEARSSTDSLGADPVIPQRRKARA